MRLARLRPPWRLQLGRPGPLAGCVLLLCAAAGATALTPLPGYGCPAAASSLARTSAPHPGGTAPVIAAAVLAADAGAVSDAQAAVDKHDAAVQAARSSAAAAESLGASASGARTKAQAGSYSPDTSVDVTMAQSTVDSDTSSLASDKEQVTFYQGLVDASKSDPYSAGSYDSSLASAKRAVTQADNDLTRAKAGLQAAKAKDAAASASQAQKERDAADLSAKAEQATTDAQVLVGLATTVDATLREAVTSARQVQADRARGNHDQVDTWTHAHRVQLDSVTAANAVLGACRRAGSRTLEVAGGLLIVAALLAGSGLLARAKSTAWVG